MNPVAEMASEHFFLRHANVVLFAQGVITVVLLTLTRWRLILLLGSSWLEQSSALHRALSAEASHLPVLVNSSTMQHVIRGAQYANGTAVGAEVLLPPELVHYRIAGDSNLYLLLTR